MSGTAISYDTIGNPLNWTNGETLTWQRGRQLASFTRGDIAATYAYDVDGIRTSKIVNGVTTTYTHVDGTLRRMSIGNNTIEFYDNSVLYNGTEYWYVFNAQNDVIGLIDATGAYVVEYTYDSWGQLLSTTGTLADTLGKDNPFRYRGYIYDEETGWYYVSSRYYDPAIGRWLNADSTNALTDYNTIYSNHYNLYAYCINNPVMYTDPTGHMIPLLIPAIVKAVEVAVYATAAIAGIAVLAQMAVDGNLALELPEVSSAEIIPFPTPEPEPEPDIKPEVFYVPTPSPLPESDENKPKNEGVTYYHVTTLDAALSIMLSGAMIGSRYEGGYVYAWKSIPSQYARDNSGAHFGVVISFKTNASFTRDTGISDFRVAAYGPVVTTRPGPITVWDVKILG